MVLDAYQLPASGQYAGTTHFSPWSYDRHVPLAFYGTPFKPGEYDETVEPVDLAVTFASLAGVNRPSAAVGRVLIEALKPTAPPATTPAQ
jgi:predicted AlkP superfamily pyrophosphatase or phosphodiesterase